MAEPVKRKFSEVEKNEHENENETESTNRKLFPIFEKNTNISPKPPKQFKALQLAMEKAASPPVGRKRKVLFGKVESPGMSQMNLDAGQKQIGPRFCKDCGMLYAPGEPIDEEEHRKAHSRLENLVSLKLWKDVRILQSFVDGGIIIMVQCGIDGKNIMNKLKDFLGWVDSELGVGFDPNPNPSRRIFLYVFPSRRKGVVRVFGCAVSEILDIDKIAAFRVLPPASVKPNAEDIKSSDQKSRDIPTSIQVGVTRLWTDKDFRKRQIASRLCDSIRFHSGILGYVVPKNKFGILEPSEDGRAFMYRYSEGTGSLYSCIA